MWPRGFRSCQLELDLKLIDRLYITGVVNFNTEINRAVGRWRVDIALVRSVSSAGARVGSAIGDQIITWGSVGYRTEIGEIVSVTDKGV